MDPIGPIPGHITTRLKYLPTFQENWGTKSLKLLELHQSQGRIVSLVFRDLDEPIRF
jgi:hypothetical protein